MRFGFVSNLIGKIFTLSLLSSISLWSLDPATAPGSRTVYVFFIDGNRIQLKLRSCRCCDRKTCMCCDNFVDDQPAIQGCARIFSHLCHSLFNITVYPASNDNKQMIEYLPIKNFLTRFENTEFQEYFERIENGAIVSPGDFSHLIRSGKIPVADFDPENIHMMQFHNMIHDLNNHVPFWLFLENNLRDMAIRRYKYFFGVLESIKQDAHDEPLNVLLDVLISWGSIRIDTSMGTLNNLFFKEAAHGISIDFKQTEVLEKIGNNFSLFLSFVECTDSDGGHCIELANNVWLRGMLPAVALAIAQDSKNWQDKEFRDDKTFADFMLFSGSERIKAADKFQEIVNKCVEDGNSNLRTLEVANIVDAFLKEIPKRTAIIKNVQHRLDIFSSQ